MPTKNLPVAMAAVLVLVLALLSVGYNIRRPRQAESSQDDAEPSPASIQLGLVINDPRAFPGYTLIAPTKSTQSYLFDMEGRVVRQWTSDCTPGLTAYLLDNGHLLRTGLLKGAPSSIGLGAGGRVQEFTWDGELVWDFKFSKGRQLSHHDIARLPNGNVLLLVWDWKGTAEAVAAGRRPDLVDSQGLTPDSVVEVKPTGKTTGDIVWEWHLWDHLIQDYNPSKANYGNVAEHPERVDINYSDNVVRIAAADTAGVDKLRSIGYVGSTARGKLPRLETDCSHINGLDYNADLDQIMLTSLEFGEFWIIDHSTSTATAAGRHGGRSGKGGDLLYRWGNPSAFRTGEKTDQRLFAPHHAHWIPRGLPGAGHVLVFNNGPNRPGVPYSSVEEVVLPVDKDGYYSRPSGSRYGPEQPIWSYTAPNKSDLFSTFLSSAQRLPNGNTLICSGNMGTLLEVTREKEIVWKYVNPSKDELAPGEIAPQKTGGSSMPRAYRYAQDYPGLSGKDLTPGKLLE